MRKQHSDINSWQSANSTGFSSILLCAIAIAPLFLSTCQNVNSHIKQPLIDSVLKTLSKNHVKNRQYSYADMILLDASFAEIKNPDITYLAEKYFVKIEYYSATQKDFGAAITYADSCINLLQDYSNNKQLSYKYAYALYEKANIYYFVKSYNEAIRYLTATKLAWQGTGSIQDSSLLYKYLLCMANTLYAQRKFLQAAAFFKLKINWAHLAPHDGIKPATQKYLVVQENIDNVGECYQNAGLRDSAIFFYDSALNYINRNEGKVEGISPPDFAFQKAVVYSNLARMRFNQNDFDGAKALYLKTIADIDTTDHNFHVAIKLQWLTFTCIRTKWSKHSSNCTNWPICRV